MAGEWNHNIPYHPLLLDAVPRPCAELDGVEVVHGDVWARP